VIKTEQAANWYTQKITMPIDRYGSGNIYEYETFFYQNPTTTTYNAPAADSSAYPELLTLASSGTYFSHVFFDHPNPVY